MPALQRGEAVGAGRARQVISAGVFHGDVARNNLLQPRRAALNPGFASGARLDRDVAARDVESLVASRGADEDAVVSACVSADNLNRSGERRVGREWVRGGGLQGVS